MILALLLAASGAVPAELVFEPWFSERDVAVSIARAAGSTPWIRAMAELPASAEKVYGAVVDYTHYRELMTPAVKSVTILESGPDSARLHFVWPYPFPFRNRDAVVSYEGQRLSDGSFLLSWQNAGKPGDPKEGVRIEHVAGETRIEPLGADRCRVTYTYLGDLGGSFPKAAEEKAWRHEPLGYMAALRRRLGLAMPGKQASLRYSPVAWNTRSSTSPSSWPSSSSPSPSTSRRMPGLPCVSATRRPGTWGGSA